MKRNVKHVSGSGRRFRSFSGRRGELPGGALHDWTTGVTRGSTPPVRDPPTPETRDVCDEG